MIILLPFAIMFVTAVRPRDELFVYPPTWTFSEFRWDNFVDMWVKTNFGGALLNSLYVSIAATVIAHRPQSFRPLMRSRAIGSWARVLYRNFLLMTQMMSPIVLVLGLFRLMVQLGMVDSLNSLVVTYAAFNMAFTIWMLQSYFNTIPRDLEEAAWIDGAGHFKSLTRIFLPLAVPAMVVTAIFTFINSWNEFVLALTMLRSSERLHLAGPDLCPGRRPLPDRMASRDGCARCWQRCLWRSCSPGSSATSSAAWPSERSNRRRRLS